MRVQANDCRIWATDIPYMSLLYAIRPGKKQSPVGDYFSVEFAPTGPVFRAAYDFVNMLSPGVVYVVKRDGFTSAGCGEFYATTPIKPFIEVPVRPEDFNYYITPLSPEECAADDMRLVATWGKPPVPCTKSQTFESQRAPWYGDSLSQTDFMEWLGHVGGGKYFGCGIPGAGIGQAAMVWPNG